MRTSTPTSSLVQVSRGLIRRHDAIKFCLASLCSHARITAYVEPEGLLSGSMRPDLVITSLGPNEKDTAIDVTVTSPFSVKRDAIVPLVAAKAMEARKRKKVCGRVQERQPHLLSIRH